MSIEEVNLEFKATFQVHAYIYLTLRPYYTFTVSVPECYGLEP